LKEIVHTITEKKKKKLRERIEVCGKKSERTHNRKVKEFSFKVSKCEG
jgi:hypothetical protein